MVRRLWWLHPAWIFAMVVSSTMVAAYWQAKSAYLLYGTPKYVKIEHLVMAFAAIAVFAIGGKLASLARAPQSLPATDGLKTVRTLYYATLALTAFGYLMWFGVGIKNGFHFGQFMALVTGSDKDLYGTLRQELFTTIPGVTTCTQFGVAAMLLGTWLFVHGEKRTGLVLLLLMSVAAFRAILFSERTALLELLLPPGLVILRGMVLGKPWPAFIRKALLGAPIFAVVGLLLFFGGFEYFRSWHYYQTKFDSYPEFVVWRLSGYFTTAHNNGAMALETNQPRPLPYFTWRPLWEFPGVASSPFGYKKLTGIDMGDTHDAMLEKYGTIELNNEGGLFQAALDYGWAGFLLYWFAYGFCATKLYRRYMAGTLGGVTIYPLVYLSLLEVPLVLLLFYTRLTPPVVTLALCAWFASRGEGGRARDALALTPSAAHPV